MHREGGSPGNGILIPDDEPVYVSDASLFYPLGSRFVPFSSKIAATQTTLRLDCLISTRQTPFNNKEEKEIKDQVLPPVRLHQELAPSFAYPGSLALCSTWVKLGAVGAGHANFLHAR